MALVALPLMCAILSETVGASMFISAFVGGMAVRAGYPKAGDHCVEFIEDWGQLFNFFVFFLFGLLVSRIWVGLGVEVLLYAFLSLTVIRMLPVALALRGTGLSRPTVIFMGWFGPRGLASIVLGLIYLQQEIQLPGESLIKMAVTATVLLSVLAHGFSALPGIDLYAKCLLDLPPEAPEREEGTL